MVLYPHFSQELKMMTLNVSSQTGKKYNEFIIFQHFKMDVIVDVVRMIKPDNWMYTVDLKNDFYSVKT